MPPPPLLLPGAPVDHPRPSRAAPDASSANDAEALKGNDVALQLVARGPQSFTLPQNISPVAFSGFAHSVAATDDAIIVEQAKQLVRAGLLSVNRTSSPALVAMLDDASVEANRAQRKLGNDALLKAIVGLANGGVMFSTQVTLRDTGVKQLLADLHQIRDSVMRSRIAEHLKI